MNTPFFARLAAAVTLAALPAAAGSITTTFVGGNGFTGNMFEATIGPSAITVNSLAVNVAAGPLTIDVYIKTGTYIGFETTPAAWTLVSATAVTGLGSGNHTAVAVTPFALAAGTSYGLYVTTTTPAGTTMFYTDGSSSPSNADLSLSLGEGLGGIFGSTSVISNRIWNGTINYNLGNTIVPEPAPLALLALAAPGFWLLRRRRHFLKY
jgi:hypothetical protein